MWDRRSQQWWEWVTLVWIWRLGLSHSYLELSATTFPDVREGSSKMAPFLWWLCKG